VGQFQTFAGRVDFGSTGQVVGARCFRHFGKGLSSLSANCKILSAAALSGGSLMASMFSFQLMALIAKFCRFQADRRNSRQRALASLLSGEKLFLLGK
jgi:hypothetical protein